MKLLLLFCLFAAAIAEPEAEAEPWWGGYHRGYLGGYRGYTGGYFPYHRGYYGSYRRYWKREADSESEPESKAESDPYLVYSGVSPYYGTYNYLNYPSVYRSSYFGHHPYTTYAGYHHLVGKREAESEPESEPESDPYLVYSGLSPYHTGYRYFSPSVYRSSYFGHYPYTSYANYANYHVLGKRDAEAEPEPWYYSAYGNFYNPYRSYAYRHYSPGFYRGWSGYRHW